ncbi:MAG: sigma-54-dependent Fis family transcriptional regulator, partial [Candidatus Sumerlaeia bacterium]|nr:sigma-54-dependent Fis family transcriptional regulator [Candidatus Sumerlaeia bacterium]
MATNEKAAPRILLVDDEKNLVFMLSKILTRHGYEVVIAGDGEEGRKVLEEAMPDGDRPEEADQPRPFDVLVTDLQMPKMDGMTLLKHTRENYPDLPVVVLTGHGSIQSAVDAMKIGAVDYLIKPANPEEILIVLSRALEFRDLKVENRQLRQQVGKFEPTYDIIGKSAPIQDVLQKVRHVARNRSTVMITGESGTGKELIARAVHDSSPFARYPFIAVNCGALSENLLESQLFGHKRGSFTGAVNDHIGFFQAAEGGTLFLDEISEMSPHLQVKLLRALQEREVIPVGDTQPHKINVRLICASNRDLEYEVRRRNFRQDLFYRLSIVNIHLVPLRERPDDIAELVGHFIIRFAKEYDVAPRSVQPEAMDLLLRYPWPGNIRELENVIERAFALSTNDTIDTPDLPPPLFRTPEEALAAVAPLDEGPAGSGEERRSTLPPGRP